MSEPIPEAIPTTSRFRRPDGQPATKKRALTPTSQHSAQLQALFKSPDREINIPSTSTALSRNVAAPPEIVANVQGSSAGAGSGEFHVYKASRRREYERLRVMDEEVEREEKDREFEAKRAEREKADEEKLKKNREKRERAKARKGKAGKGGGESGGVVKSIVGKRKLGAAKVLGSAGGSEDVEEQGTGVDGGYVQAEEIGITFHDDD